jgi:hypothetical protein
LFSLSFYILKSLHNNFIIYLIEVIFLNVYNQTIIYLLISYPIPQYTINNMYNRKNSLSIVAVATARSNDNLINIYTNENIKFFFVFIIFYSGLTIPSILENSSSLHRLIIYVLSRSSSIIRFTIENSLG